MNAIQSEICVVLTLTCYRFLILVCESYLFGIIILYYFRKLLCRLLYFNCFKSHTGGTLYVCGCAIRRFPIANFKWSM